MNKSSKPIDDLAAVIGMTADQLRDAAKAIRAEQMKERLMAKVRLIREGNTAILPTGEIVPRGTEGAMDYESIPTKDQTNEPKIEGAI